MHAHLETNIICFRLSSTYICRVLELIISISSCWQAPPPQLNDFMLPDDLEHVPDVIAVGTQESFSERFEWEVHIQETVGPSHLLLHSATLGTIHLAIFIRRDLLWYCSG